jgi:predicted secreted protein
MKFILMFGVMLILSILCLFVLLRLAVRSRESEDHPGTWNLKSQASCALDHFFLPTHVLINHNDLHRIILKGPNRLP